MNFGFHTKRENVWLAELLVASQEWFYSFELDSTTQCRNWRVMQPTRLVELCLNYSNHEVAFTEARRKMKKKQDKNGDSRKSKKIKRRKWRVGMKGSRRRGGIWFVTASSGIFVLSDRRSDTIVRAWQLHSPPDAQHRSRWRVLQQNFNSARHPGNKKCLIRDTWLDLVPETLLFGASFVRKTEYCCY
jgi:hypothetical protein